ncbi:hypothetical protein EJD88_11050 [Pseudomonas sp. PB105]|uniref:hypothetical protein n=1 Tax=Pseudomonas TaxID=286 RepID=UPI00131AF92B|nr:MULTISPECIES: hypothetical protein [Pseudomonas]KAE9655810.1 hypothetical protein EJD88_11050 [Pseudomonas sp. PB105]MBD8238320.1 hypothetical protein [Pseudomonas fluorescens]MDY0895917.1 hypothetical protein [Pseudomonas fluorescens]MVW99045.1 hypothetical protein [Pseudomonas sp. PB100]
MASGINNSIQTYNYGTGYGDQGGYGASGGGSVEAEAAKAKALQIEGMRLNNEVKYDNNYSTSAQKRQ